MASFLETEDIAEKAMASCQDEANAIDPDQEIEHEPEC
jgi:hypothetical protein